MSNKDTAIYLASIDGLRAIAVATVVLFHVDFAFMRGGFIGVDVFFVISGFLITSNIVRDIENGRWRFANFYRRRIARLFPALFTVVGASVVAAYFILAPEDLLRLAKTALAAVFSVSNVFFFTEAGYFDSSAITKPLLHTWSLSVEEQFYLVWPLCLYLLLARGSRNLLSFTLIGISTVSIIAAVTLNRKHPELVFFLTPFRAYQFGFGALLALSGIALSSHAQRIKSVIAIGGAACLLALAVHADETSHIFFIAVLPALAATGFIVGSETRFIKILFASAPFVWVGRRSYSIYLTHWPIIVLWKMEVGPHFDLGDKLLAVTLSVLSGAVLYVLVERRFRLSSDTIPRLRFRSMATTVALLCLVLSVSGVYITKAGFPGRVPVEVLNSMSDTNARWILRKQRLRSGVCNIPIHELTEQSINEFDPAVCLTPSPSKRAYLVIGDSYASGAYLLFTQAYPEVYFGQITLPGCRILPLDKIENEYCAELFRTALSSEQVKNQYDGVILASDWNRNDLNSLKNLLAELSEQHQRIVMLGQRIRFSARVPTIIASSLSLSDASRKAQSRLLDYQIKTNQVMKEKYSSIVHYIDLIPMQCPSECEIFTTENQLMYLDEAHFSLDGVQVLAQRLRETYPNLLRKEVDRQ